MIVVIRQSGCKVIAPAVPKAKHVLVTQVLLKRSEDVFTDFKWVGRAPPCDDCSQ